MLNNSTDIIVELTAEGKQKYISPVVERITGYTPRELQVPFTEVIHPDDVERIKEHWKEVLSRPDIIHRDEYRHIHKTEGYVWMEASLKSYLDNPDIQSIICSVRDITERKKNEKLLRENEEHYKMLSKAATEMLALDNMDEIYDYITYAMSEQFPDAVCVFVTVDEKHSKARVAGIKGLDNSLLKKALDLTGYNIIGKEFNVLPSHSIKYKTGKLTLFENKLEDFAANEFPSAAARSIEKLLGIHKIYAIGINKDDTLYAILHFFTLRKSDLANHAYIESFIKQAGIIIERKIMEQQLKESEKRLSEANATKDKFFSIIAHDLRNPFNLLLGFSEMNLGYIKDKNYAKVEESEKMIRESAEQGYVLLNNLLEWAQSQQGSLEFNPDYHNISERIRKVRALLSNQAYQKEIVINNELKNDLTIYADANMFDTILRNLVFNAIKYSNKGGTVTIHAEQQKYGTKVSVSDTGVGMEQENIDKLFNLKENYTSRGTKGEHGTGLGLILCKEFVDKHGGTLDVESQPGQGSTFWFTLPHKKFDQ